MSSPPNSSPSCFRVLDTAVVTPSGPPLLPSSLPLTFLDLQWIHAPPVERIFFYRLQETTTEQVISGLKASLSRALRIFFPLAGHLRVTPGMAAHHDIYYEPGDGVAFMLAEYDGADLASDNRPRQVIELAKLVPHLHTINAGAVLLVVQATVLLPRGDLALGVTVHHAACDGAGSTAFLHTWAAACGIESLSIRRPPPPVFDRTLIVDGRLYDQYARNQPSADKWEFVKTSPDQLLATFTLSSEQLQGVKDAVSGEAVRHGLTPPRCSMLVAALGFVWSYYHRAKSAEGDATVYFIIPVDHRRGMKVPVTYLGNCLSPAIAAAPCKNLASPGVSGLLSACAAIAAGIEKAIASPEWETVLERVMEAAKHSVLSVTGSPRFCVYDVDFGFGPPAKVDIVSAVGTGAMAVAERGRGGIEVGMSFLPTFMEAFQRCFADAVAWLSPSSSTD